MIGDVCDEQMFFAQIVVAGWLHGGYMVSQLVSMLAIWLNNQCD